jgi:putative ABC transport system permease protein
MKRIRRALDGLDDDIRDHIDRETQDNIDRGMSPEEARRQALLKFGNIALAKEDTRAVWSWQGLEHLAQDVRYALRVLRRNPVFATTVILTLALGIGANTAIFSVVNAVLLRPLPFPDSDRLVMIWATNTKNGNTQDVASYPDVEEWRAQSRSFEDMAAFTSRGATLVGGGQAELVPAMQVMPRFFETLGVPPAMGRTFHATDQESGSRVAVLSDAAWRRLFSGRSDVIGQTLRINEATHTVIGVMPPDFRFAPQEPEQVFTVIAPDPNRNHGFLRTIGRLRPGISRAAAQAEMHAITRRIAEQFPKSNDGVGANVIPLVDAMVGDTRQGLLICLGVVTLVLLIACTNVVNLLLARKLARRRELGLRAALGAGRWRLTKQLLTESLLLAMVGGAAGLVLASWIAPLLAAMLADTVPIPRLETTRTDTVVLGFTLLVSMATALLCGGLHALTAAAPDLNVSLHESSGTATDGPAGARMRAALVITETALALLLLAGAGTLLKTLLVMQNTAPGFTSANVLTFSFWLPKTTAERAPERTGFYEKLIAGVGSLPGVESASVVSSLPLGGGFDSLGFRIVGRPNPAPDGYYSANFNIAGPGYFRTMRIPLRAGREFSERDSGSAPPSIVINETAAERFWAGEDPRGRQITMGQTPRTIIGVVGDVRQASLGAAPRPEIFLNYLQPGPDWPYLTLVARTTVPPTSLAASLRAVVQSVDRNVPIVQMRTLDEVLSGSMAEPRVYTVLLGASATLALMLAGIGLYGVVAYGASQRAREIGIRQALGAGRGEILRLVLRHGLTLSAAGVVLGVPGGIALTRLLTSIVPNADPADPVALAAASVLLLAVALVAACLPAARACRTDPLLVLRQE